jgi:hypothetical protein
MVQEKKIFKQFKWAWSGPRATSLIYMGHIIYIVDVVRGIEIIVFIM